MIRGLLFKHVTGWDTIPADTNYTDPNRYAGVVTGAVVPVILHPDEPGGDTQLRALYAAELSQVGGWHRPVGGTARWVAPPGGCVAPPGGWVAPPPGGWHRPPVGGTARWVLRGVSTVYGRWIPPGRATDTWRRVTEALHAARLPLPSRPAAVASRADVAEEIAGGLRREIEAEVARIPAPDVADRGWEIAVVDDGRGNWWVIVNDGLTVHTGATWKRESDALVDVDRMILWLLDMGEFARARTGAAGRN